MGRQTVRTLAAELSTAIAPRPIAMETIAAQTKFLMPVIGLRCTEYKYVRIVFASTHSRIGAVCTKQRSVRCAAYLRKPTPEQSSCYVLTPDRPRLEGHWWKPTPILGQVSLNQAVLRLSPMVVCGKSKAFKHEANVTYRWVGDVCCTTLFDRYPTRYTRVSTHPGLVISLSTPSLKS